MGGGLVTLFLGGDVMTGRGVDQILPHPGDPRLRERAVRDARTYVELAEGRNGPVPHPVDYGWPWGEALRTLNDVAPDVRVINLETSVTRSDERAPEKAVLYRMNPENLGCLSVAGVDVCTLGNNHVLDFGIRGLQETLDSLHASGIATVGAGLDANHAKQPTSIRTQGGRVVILSFGARCSGIPRTWAATSGKPGVAYLPDLSPDRAAAVTDQVRQVKHDGDIVVASIHWGSNWGYDATPDQVDFAHRLVDGGVDIVHGHSSHHPRPIEIHGGKLVLYGCGDLIDDYEGITGHEEYRDDLRLLYFPSVDLDTGRLSALRMAPMQVHRMGLRRPSLDDTEWLRDTIERISRPFETRIDSTPEGLLSVAAPSY